MVTDADLRLLPAKPGVYIMRDGQGKVLYVGKARLLKNRVRSYFQEGRPLDPRIQAMVNQIDRFEFITTASEVEALALESNLIKEHHPRYNVRLRDDKQYPMLKVTWDEEYPRLLIVRRAKNDGARYFGPYTDNGAMRETLRLIRRLFPLRSCKRRIGIEHVERPCLNHHIHRCMAPCVDAVTVKTYRELAARVCLFLEGNYGEILDDLENKMESASANLDFERAAAIRDQLADLRIVAERQKVVSMAGEDYDVLGMAGGAEGSLVQVFIVRQGKLIRREHYLLTAGAASAPSETLEAFAMQHYDENPRIPPLILSPYELEGGEALAKWLSGLRGRSVKISFPQRGEKKQLVLMAMENAALLLEQERVKRAYADERASRALRDLADALVLPAPPRRMEAFDISNISGEQAVASMAVFVGGMPAPAEYRKFRIKTVQGANDFAMLQEATGRRFRRGLKEIEEGKKGGFADLPDLVLIDGGKGQLNAVLSELEGIAVLPALIGLAKENEEIYLPGRNEPLILPRDSEALYLVQRIRDEAHRFAVAFHRSVRDKSVRGSLLDRIKGIGPKRRKALLRQFGSIRRVMAASLDELLQVEGMTSEAAEALYTGLHRELK